MLAFLKIVLLTILAIFILPVLIYGALWMSRDHPRSWRDADWSSAGILPDPTSDREASIRVLSARTGGYKGILSVHTWLVLKHPGARSYTRYDVVGWGNPVRRNAYPPDGRWYSNEPEITYEISGLEAERLLPKVEAAIRSYQWSEHGSYRIWPGPNSNTFVATILASVPELQASMPPTAIGRDYRTGIFRTGTGGYAISLGGLTGVTAGLRDGLQVNFLGLVAGIRFARPALIIPGFGAIGF